MGTVPFNSDIDLQLNQILNARMQMLSAAPDPLEARIYYDTTLHKFGYYNGTKWVYDTELTSANIIAGLGYTPYDAANPEGYITSASVGDGVTTFQKNGTAIGTISANQSGASTINITVPTQASDIGALADTTKYGATLTFTIDPTTYVLTATLKDQDGNTLGTAQTVDLPLENVVVDGSYDSTNKQIILTLENGNTIDIPVADLVAGLQNEITATNKLSADLVDDTSSAHKFATAAQLTQIATNASNISTLQSEVADLPRKLTTTNPALIVSGGVGTWNITNSLGTADVNVLVYRVSDGVQVITEVDVSANTIVVKFNSTSNIAAGTYKAVVIG